jgi:membrane-bound lytic murein transglycosylase MltF
VLGDGRHAQAPTEKGRLGLALSEITKPWTGDLDGMVERRMIRVLATFSKTQYFVDAGTPRGTAYDQGKLLEEELNKKRASGHSAIRVQFVPLSRNELIPALLEGKGDIVMADLTVTPERQKAVEFVDPWIAGVEEIVVTKPGGPTIESVAGAIGVMQVMPATGKELGVGDIRKLEANVHAGVKYIRFLVDRYYAREPMDDLNKVLFAFAAYNAGPSRVRQLRREAAENNLDPNIWFNNVERIAAARIGRETVTYVSNIYKYYVTYLLIQGEYIQRRELKKKAS